MILIWFHHDTDNLCNFQTVHVLLHILLFAWIFYLLVSLYHNHHHYNYLFITYVYVFALSPKNFSIIFPPNSSLRSLIVFFFILLEAVFCHLLEVFQTSPIHTNYLHLNTSNMTIWFFYYNYSYTNSTSNTLFNHQ